MRSVHGATGYGMYMIILEVLVEQPGHSLDIAGRYSYTVLSKELGCSAAKAKRFVNDCVDEFHIFNSDGRKIWSEYLNEKMQIIDEGSAKRSADGTAAANVRWHGDANSAPVGEDEGNPAMQSHSGGSAVAVQGNDSKAKGKDTTTKTDDTSTKNTETITKQSQAECSCSVPASEKDDMCAACFFGREDDIFDMYHGMLMTKARRLELMKLYKLSDEDFKNVYFRLCSRLDHLSSPPPNYGRFVEEFFREKAKAIIPLNKAPQSHDEIPAAGSLN